MHASSVSVADSGTVAGALPSFATSTAKRARERPRRRCGRAATDTCSNGSIVSVARARAATAPLLRETTSTTTGHARASESGERGGANTSWKGCSWPSPEPNGSRYAVGGSSTQPAGRPPTRKS